MSLTERGNEMSKGRYGIHGGQYISETLMNELIRLEEAYEHYKKDPEFVAELNKLFNEYAGRPSLLYYAEKMTKDLGGAKIYLKREDLNHTGSHKINNVLGQALLAKKMGKTRLIAETGAGQHGVATATAAALLEATDADWRIEVLLPWLQALRPYAVTEVPGVNTLGSPMTKNYLYGITSSDWIALYELEIGIDYYLTVFER